MATEAQLKALAKARAARKRNLRSGKTRGRRGALHGIGLGNLKSVKSKDIFDSFKGVGMTLLGFVAGKAGGAALRKIVIKPGDEDTFKRFIEPIAQLGGGFIISQTGKGNQFVKSMGNGIMLAGAVTGVEVATKKTLMELIGMEDSIAVERSIEGMGNANDIDMIDFNPELPDLQSPGGVDERGNELPHNEPVPQGSFSGTEDGIIL